MKAIKLAAITAAMLFSSAAIHAASLTYNFEGVMLDGYGFDGQTVLGSLTVDTGLYSHTVGDGSTWAQGYGENSAGPGLFHATISLSGGLSMVLGGPAVQFPTAETYVYKNHSGMDQFIVDGGAEVDSTTMGFIQLRTTDYAGDPSQMFPDASPADLSFDQRVRFNTATSYDVGYFYLGNGTDANFGNFRLTTVTGSGVVTAVPEPTSVALLLAGLAAISVATSRKRAKGQKR